jgi:hypothetical protein
VTGAPPHRLRPRLHVFDDFVGAEARAALSAALDPCRLLDAGFAPSFGPAGRTFEVPPAGHPLLAGLAERLTALVGLQPAVELSFRVRHAHAGDAHPLHTDLYPVDGALLYATAMIYLDTGDCRGGETVFPEAVPPLALEPRPGRVVVWFNSHDGAHADPASVHAMRRVESGGRLSMNLFFYARPDALPAAEGLAAEWAASLAPAASVATFTCVDDTAAPQSAASLQRACRARGGEFRHVFAAEVDPEAAPLPPGSMLYCVSTTPAAERVTRQLWQPGVVTFHRGPGGPFEVVVDPLRWFTLAGLPVPRFAVIEPGCGADLEAIAESLGGWPLVVKSPGGEGGVGTLRADSPPALRGLLDLLHARGVAPTLMSYVPDALHLRVVVVGDRAVTAYRNPVPDGDFRSRPSADPADYGVPIPTRVASLAVRATHALGLDFAGVDVLLHASGRAYLLEANFPCYFPQAEAHGTADVAGAMVAHLLRRPA